MNVSVAKMRVNPRALVKQLSQGYSQDIYAPLTGEDIERVRAALKAAGIDYDRLRAHNARNVLKTVMEWI